MRDTIVEIHYALAEWLSMLSSEVEIKKTAASAAANRAVADLVRLERQVCGLHESGNGSLFALITSIQDDVLDAETIYSRTHSKELADKVLALRELVAAAIEAAPKGDTHALNDQTVRQQVRALTDGRCSYCDCDLPDNWHIDHVVPKSAGGPDNIANYVPSCPSCNISKNGNHVLDFIKKSRGKVVAFRSEGAA